MKSRLVIVAWPLLLLVAVGPGCGRLTRMIRPSKLTGATLSWDLSGSHELRNIGWETKAPVDNQLMSKYLQEDGDLDLTLTLSGGRIFHEHVQHIYVTRSNS